MNIRRIAVIVLDGVGVGELPDAGAYGDIGSNSLSNTARVLGGLNMPNMARWGWGTSRPCWACRHANKPAGLMENAVKHPKGKIPYRSLGIDGVEVKRPFPTYPNGFPKEVLDDLPT
jgi:phosphopentomutase